MVDLGEVWRERAPEWTDRIALTHEMSARLRTIEELLLTCLREKWTVRPDGRSMFATDRDGLRSIEYRGTRIRNRRKQPAIDPPISERRRNESEGILSLHRRRLQADLVAPLLDLRPDFVANKADLF